jgi:hypothetical protein
MKNAFSVFVFGEYERFLPFYVLSINQNYNNVDILIFYDKKLSKEIKDNLCLRDNVIIYENFNENTNWLQNLKIREGGPKTLLRFLIKGKYFLKYKYVYFGDVDVLIFNETESLFKFHQSQLDSSRVPFSNKVRLDENKKLSKRLTGLHLVEVEPYFKKIDPVIDKFFSNEIFRKRILSGVIRDEEFLYNICKIGFNFDPLLLSLNNTPLHGIHLGLFRHNINPKISHLEKDSFESVTIKRQLSELNKQRKLDKLLQEFYCKEVFRSYKFFNVKLKFYTEQIYKFKFLKKESLFWINKFKNKLITS